MADIATVEPKQIVAGDSVQWKISLAARLPQNLTNSQFKAGTAATAEAVFDIQKNGSSIGSATFAASGTSASFTFSSDRDFAVGDYLDIIAPSSQDSTLADISFSLKGSR